METTLIVIFLAFASVSFVTNTLVIFYAYRGFATLTATVTEGLRELETSGSTREWIAALHKASEQAITITESTKWTIRAYDPVLEMLQGRYEFVLAKIDTKVERLAQGACDGAERLRDSVSRPAERFGAVATGINSMFGFLAPIGRDDDFDR